MSNGTTRQTEPFHASPAADPGSRLRGLRTPELLTEYGAIIDELQARGVVRTRNSPVGDYAEYLFAQAFGWKLEPNSKSGFDAFDGEIRYQIKCRRLDPAGRGSRQLSVFRQLDLGKFDLLAAVLFDHRYRVGRAALVPHALILQRSTYISHVNGWRFILDDGVWAESTVIDLTDRLREAEKSL